LPGKPEFGIETRFIVADYCRKGDPDMVRKVRGFLVIAALGTIAWDAAAQDLPNAPMPIVPSGPSTPRAAEHLPTPILSGPPPIGLPAPALQEPAPYQDNNGPLLRGDPLLDQPQSPPPGWFVGLELNAVGPHIKNRLQAPVTVADTVLNPVHLPTADLDWAGAPRFELGYRLAEGWGEFVASYRFLVSEGTQNLPGFDLDGSDGFLKSRLNLNVLDLDYSSREYSLLPYWDMKWKAGVRLANVFFDSHALGVFLEERTSNNFFGAGPHAGLDLWRSLGTSGLGIFGRIEGASVVGQISQSFEAVGFASDGSLVGGATLVHHTQAVPTLNVQAGLGWSRWWAGHWSRYAIGYEFERWWYLGEAASSRGELTTQGIFFRGEFNF
jgi:hypothetical protein